jgi:hypothetical protein
MPIVKQNKQLDGPNSIYSASRKLASRQLKNMKSVALDDSEDTASKMPFATSNTSQDTEGLVPQLLQNLSDVNGLMSSLKLVGRKSDDDTPTNTPRKRPRGGARKTDDINKLKAKIEKEQAKQQIAENSLKKYENSPSPTPADRESNREVIKHLKAEITRAKGNIRRYRIKIAELEKEDTDEGKGEGQDAQALNVEGRRIHDEIVAYLEDYKQSGAVNENVVPLLRQLNVIHDKLGIPNLYINQEGDLLQVEGEGNAPRPPIPPIQDPDDTQEEQYNVEVDDADEGDDDDGEDIDVSNFDFSKVSKSTLLVILNQLKSLVKKGELILKRIVNGNITSSESDLNTITDELSELISSKRFLLSHLDQIRQKGRDIAEYLQSILSTMVGKYAENLKTFVKRYAQLNREQINSIQEGDIAEGAGRHFAVSNRPVVLSNMVRHISKYDRKYML